MGTILNEIFDNFGKFAEEQAGLDKPTFDQSQFGIITASQEDAAVAPKSGKVVKVDSQYIYIDPTGKKKHAEEPGAIVRVHVVDPHGQHLEHHYLNANEWGAPAGRMDPGDTYSGVPELATNREFSSCCAGDQARYLESSIIVTAEDKNVLLEKRHPFGLETEDIIGVAHPEKAHVAEGPKESGVVDNLNEQQKKIVNMVNKMPTGNVVHNFSFANEVAELVAIANELDEIGLVKEAEELTKVAADLAALKKKL